jgi:nucleoside-diphosphate-sugar epimerase
MSTYLVTGCAGFIANEVACQLLDAGHRVVGIDNVNDYYDVRLKEHRLERLEKHSSDAFEMVRGDIENLDTLQTIFDKHDFDAVLNEIMTPLRSKLRLFSARQ